MMSDFKMISQRYHSLFDKSRETNEIKSHFCRPLFDLSKRGGKRGGREIGFEFDINYWAAINPTHKKNCG